MEERKYLQVCANCVVFTQCLTQDFVRNDAENCPHFVYEDIQEQRKMNWLIMECLDKLHTEKAT